MQAAKYVSSGRNALTEEDLLDEINTHSTATIPNEATLELEGFPGDDEIRLTSLAGKKMLVVCETAALCLTDEICDVAKLRKIARITASNKIYSEILSGEDGNLIVVRCVVDIPEVLVYQWLKIVFSFSPSAVTLLGSVRHASLVTRRTDGATLKYIASSCSSASGDLSSLKRITALEPGNIVTGALAATMSYCEVRNIDAVAILCARGAALSVEDARSYELAIPYLEKCLEIDAIPHPPKASYVASMKSDAFLSMTENIYT
jgi:predicted ATP-grasp superfamily ATP-dependent carboligase